VTAMDGKCCCCCVIINMFYNNDLTTHHFSFYPFPSYCSRLCFEASRKDSLRFRWLNKPTPFVLLFIFEDYKNWIFLDPPYTQRPASCTKRSTSFESAW
jgi:hypothetical protein